MAILQLFFTTGNFEYVTLKVENRLMGSDSGTQGGIRITILYLSVNNMVSY
jgi:hypothetical protein